MAYGILRRRLRLLLLIFLVVINALIWRLGFLQIYKSPILTEQALQSKNFYIPAEEVFRGDIVDCNGKSLLDQTTEDALLVFPRMLDNYDNIKALAYLLNDTPDSIEKDIYSYSENTTGKAPRIIKYKLEKSQKEKIENAQIPGVYFLPIIARYGSGSLARHLIGHLSSGKGIKGIELFYDDYLSNEQPQSFWKFVLDARGNVIPGLSFKEVENKEVKQNKVMLTIDKDIQTVVENVMNNFVESGAILVMNPQNGDILAIASRPNYSQNIIENLSSDMNYRNKAFELFHPGPIFKVLVAAAALEEQVVDIDEEFKCDGNFIFPTGLEISCWKKSGHGNVNIDKALALSCNTTFIEIALRLGRNRLIEYSEKMGLTENRVLGYPMSAENGIDIQYGPGKVANAALGQEGIRISPVQVGVLISAIANGGKRITPRVVKGVLNSEDVYIKKIFSERPVRVLKEETALQIGKFLADAVSWGTGENAWVENLGAAGKTGSAQIGATNENGEKALNTWFAGYAPLEDPQYVVVVLIENGKSGGESAAPVFRKVVDEILELN